MTNSRDPAMLHPTLQRGLAELRLRMYAEGYHHVGVSSTFRDKAYQDHLFAQGRTRPGNIVTNARGGQSIHNHLATLPGSHDKAALAFDIFQNIRGREWETPFFNTAGRIWQTMGGTWGGAWTNFVDRPHFEYTAGRTLRDIQNGFTLPQDHKMPWEQENPLYLPTVDGDIEEYIYNSNDKEVTGMTRFNTTQEMPDWARPTIEKLIERGIIKGRNNGELDLSEDMIRIFVVHDRAGMYDGVGMYDA